MLGSFWLSGLLRLRTLRRIRVINCGDNGGGFVLKFEKGCMFCLVNWFSALAYIGGWGVCVRLGSFRNLLVWDMRVHVFASFGFSSTYNYGSIECTCVRFISRNYVDFNWGFCGLNVNEILSQRGSNVFFLNLERNLCYLN